MSTPVPNLNWVEVRALESTREADPGEKLAVILVPSDGSAEKVYQFSSLDAQQLTLYRWPGNLCRAINAAPGAYMRGGEVDASGQIVPLSSSYRNKLWRPWAQEWQMYLVLPQLENWTEQYTVLSTSAVVAGSTIEVKVLSAQRVIETINCNIDAQNNGQFRWPAQLCRYVNANALRLRGGEKDVATQRFSALSSQYRNKLWTPADSGLRLEVRNLYPVAAFDDARRIFAALVARHLGTPVDASVIDQWLMGFGNGRFADIRYPASAQNVVDIAPIQEHLTRLKAIADFVVRQPQAPANYVASALAGLSDYVSRNYQSSNWWYRQIGLARQVGVLCLLLTKSAPEEKLRLTAAIDYLRGQSNVYGQPTAHTGANLADVALIQAYWAAAGYQLLAATQYLNHLASAADAVSTLCLAVPRAGNEDGEGVLIDYSFSQHNQMRNGVPVLQLYTGAYGAVLLNAIFQCHAALAGAFALRVASLRELARFLARGVGWSVYAGQWDWHVLGRSISRSPGSIRGIANYVDSLGLSPSDESYDQLQELKLRASSSMETSIRHYAGNRVFWANEYMSHLTPTFACWAKVVSTRTLGSESGNGENPKAYFMGAGSYFVTRTGTEYRGIQPCLDWQCLPGTTVEQAPNYRWPNIAWGYNTWGSDIFAGGVSDGSSGLLSVRLSRDSIKNAFKTLFALPDRIVAIGTSINALEAMARVCTTVNQALLQGPVYLFFVDGTRVILEMGSYYAGADLIGVWHAGLHYRFAAALHQRIRLSLFRRTGTWRDINVNGSTQAVTLDMFTLTVEHDRAASQSYQYEIVPGALDQIPASSLAIEHSCTAHGVLGHYQTLASFSTPLSFSSGVRVANRLTISGSAAILMIATVSEDGQTLTVTVADPEQQANSVRLLVRLDGAASAMPLIIDLPQGERRGASVTARMSLRVAADAPGA